MNVTDDIKDILIEYLFVEVPAAEMDPDDGLRDVFGLDSVGFVELRVQCEDRFGVSIADDEFVPENFSTIRTVAELVGRLTRPAPASA
jgi:acyl carrier protein